MKLGGLGTRLVGGTVFIIACTVEVVEVTQLLTYLPQIVTCFIIACTVEV